MFRTDGDSQAKLEAEVLRVTTTEKHLSGRGEIIEYYKDTYGFEKIRGVPSWQKHLVDKLVAQTGKSRNTVSREFQMDKRTGQERYKSANPSKPTQEKYKELGKSLPPIRVPKKVTGTPIVRFDGAVWYSETDYDKEFEVALSPDQLSALMEAPSLDPIFEAYGINVANMEAAEIYDITITFE